MKAKIILSIVFLIPFIVLLNGCSVKSYHVSLSFSIGEFYDELPSEPTDRNINEWLDGMCVETEGKYPDWTIWHTDAMNPNTTFSAENPSCSPIELILFLDTFEREISSHAEIIGVRIEFEGGAIPNWQNNESKM